MQTLIFLEKMKKSNDNIIWSLDFAMDCDKQNEYHLAMGTEDWDTCVKFDKDTEVNGILFKNGTWDNSLDNKEKWKWGPNEYINETLEGEDLWNYYKQFMDSSTLLHLSFKELGVVKYRKDILYSELDLLGKVY